MEFALVYSALGIMSALLLLSWIVFVLMPIIVPIVGILVVLVMHSGIQSRTSMFVQGRRFKPSQAVRILRDDKSAKDWRQKIIEIENFRK